MQNLFFRNRFVVGVLMVCVLALGIQGIVDALTLSKTSGDLVTVVENQQFTIRFSVGNLKSPVAENPDTTRASSTAIGYADGTRTRSNVSVSRTIDSGWATGDTHYYTTSAVATDTVLGLAITTHTRNWGIKGTDDAELPAGRSWATGDTRDILYASRGETRSNVRVSRTIDAATDDTATAGWNETYEMGDTHYYTTSVVNTTQVAGLAITTYTRNWLTESQAYDYNDESVSIAVTDSDDADVNLTLMKGNTIVSGNMALIERHEESDRRLSSSITLTGRHNAAGEYDIVITDDTAAGDFPGDTAPDTRASITFKIFVVPSIAETTAVFLPDLQECRLMGDTSREINGDFIASGNTPLVYKVEGSGRLRVGTESRLYQTLKTSAAAEVFLDMRGSSNRVTVEIQGLTKVASVHYILAPVRIEVTNGNHQTGAPGGRLDDELAVRVRDAKNRPISKLRVTFGDDTSTTQERFIPYPGTTVYVQSNPRNLATDDNIAGTISAASNTPGPAVSIHVQTDSSGIAKTYYQLGDTNTASNAHDVTVMACGAPATIFASEGSVGGVRVANLEILSGDGQSTTKGKNLKAPLVIIARSADNYRIPNVIIQFRTSIGLLTPRNTEQPPGHPLATVSTPRAANELPENTPNPRSGQQIYVVTGFDGQASVNYNIGQFTVARRVTAEVRHESLDSNYSFAIDRVDFNINGRASAPIIRDDDEDDEDEDEDEDTITVSPASVSGTTGARAQLTISPSTTPVTITGATFRSAGGLFVETQTGATRTLLLPTTAGSYTLTLSATGYTPVRVPVTVTVATPSPAPGSRTLSIRTVGAATNGQQVVEVTAAAGVTVTLSGTGFGTRTVTTASNGSVRASITLPTTVGSHTLIASASGYTSDSVTIRVSEETTPRTPPPTTTGGTPSRISISGLSTHSGAVGTPLDLPLTVRVVNANGTGVANAKVTFRVRQGDGRLSDRGNGRGISIETDRSGYARAAFTPQSAGTITVEAEVKGLTQKVTFIINTGSAPPADTTGDTRQYTVGDRLPGNLSGTYNFSGKLTINQQVYTCTSAGECVISNGIVTQGQIQIPVVEKPKPKVTTREYRVGDRLPGNLPGTYNFSGKLTINGQTYTCLSSGECVISNGIITRGQIQAPVAETPKDTETTRTISPVVHVAAANRPSMLWVDSGAIYALIGANVQRFAPSMNNVRHLAIGGGKLYWTEQTGDSAGSINSANLNGTGVRELTSITAVPMGIAVDEANSKLYWTNSRGRIQSANLDGSGIQNVMQNLTSPLDIALAGGNVYWTHANGGVGFVNLRGQKQVRNISNGADAAGSLAIGGGKVYWTEQAGENGGTINAANLNGTGATEIASILAAPMGIAVDTARSRLYWTNARGRIQSANFDGTNIKNVVSGLGNPGEIIVGNSIQAPKTTDTVASKNNTKANYDVNGDGTVDNTDASLVSAAMGTSAAKYDVNSDGVVNFLDLLLVFDNRDAGAAAAPTIVGIKLTAVQIDILQEQIELLIATGDRSPAAMRTLIYLQQLIATARPEKTQLLANYPNPFNPETWIPYELATDTEVRITIYTPTGVVVRALQLGHQTAGYYTDRERAAYWDGRNAAGEQVASGLYFYQLETDSQSLLRKMVILK